MGPRGEDQGPGAREPVEDEGFELPVRRAADDREPVMRRSLFGLRPADVREELALRDEELEVLRRDVAALWLAFGQHERTIQDLVELIARATGVEIPPPGRPPDPDTSAPVEGAAGPAPARDPELARSVGEQLTELDHALSAIERATETLERTYAGGLEGEPEGPDPAEQPEKDGKPGAEDG